MVEISQSNFRNFSGYKAFQSIAGIGKVPGPRAGKIDRDSGQEVSMRYLKYVALLAVLMMPLAYSQGQVGVGIGVRVGPGYVAGPPVCSYGYYDYAPYACAPYGYYGSSFFVNGVFIGAGPWYHWGHPAGFWNRGYYGRPGWGHGYYGRPGVRAYNRGYARGFAHGEVHGGNAFHGGGGFHGGRR
jgi:hypothetical protein